MYILGFLFFFIVSILILGLSIVGRILKALFGFGKQSTSYQSQQTRSYANRENTTETTQEVHKHKKLFDDDEGEYVDFEEIKESQK
ncbi:DUF4834 family protein [uncultured Bacteroides sp.]|uniref:DUF4834 family protein n=1 Tax=uncultured Bacteroides sp. TaxID=162156 RepID=UPI002AABC578|nr:DUF4834 family protein [uncultured Bacteroides sp.]